MRAVLFPTGRALFTIWLEASGVHGAHTHAVTNFDAALCIFPYTHSLAYDLVTNAHR
jgi:hypothetical protein